MSATALNPFVSSKFRFWSFVSMAVLVFVHGYNMQERYLQPWTIPGEPFSFSGFIEYFLANGIFRFRIPMLFIISGYLFAMHDDRSYKSRAGKRFRTLFLPYLIWSALGLAFTYGLELFPWSRALVSGSHVAQIDDTRQLLHNYKWYELLVCWLLLPIPYQLWFIRVLFIYNLAYPVLRWCVMNRTGRWIFFSSATLLWLATINVGLIEGEGLLFFSLGIWMQKNSFDIESPSSRLKPALWGIMFVSFAFIKTFLAWKGQPLLGGAVFPILTLMHKAVVLSGLVACWYGLDPMVKWFMKRTWFTWLSAFAFIIYALHTPLIAYVITPFLSLLEPMPAFHLAAFILLPIIVIGFCIITGFILRFLTPKIYSVLTGGRGM
ncbi:MAG: acyltransferase [Bacteroidota bacterium]|jgi:fucose 4-O-acetylase-like acetyltransferase